MSNILEESQRIPVQNILQTEGSGIFSNQYIIVQDRLLQKNSKQKGQNSNEVSHIDGNTSFMARYQNETLNDFDQESFLRHSEISESIFIRLDFLRDFKNNLELLSLED